MAPTQFPSMCSYHSDVSDEVRQVLPPVVDSGEAIDFFFSIQNGQIERANQLQSQSSDGCREFVKKLVACSVGVQKASATRIH